MIDFLWRHIRSIRQLFIYSMVAYSMYLVGKYRSQV